MSLDNWLPSEAIINPCCVVHMPFPCEQCDYFLYSEEYGRKICHYAKEEGYKPYDDIEALSCVE